MLCSKSEELITQGEYEKAAQTLSPYWKNFGEQIDAEGLSNIETARLLYIVGSLTSAIGSGEQIKDSQSVARDYLSKSARLFEESGEREWQAKCLSKIGVTYWKNGDFPTAQIFFDQSQEIAVTNESKAIALLNSAMAESSQSKYASALQLYLKAYSLVGSISLLTEGSIRNGIALIYKNLGKHETGEKQIEFFDKAIIEFEGALACYDEIGNKVFAVGSRINVSALYETIEYFDVAIKHLQIAKTLAYQLKDKILLAHVNENFARIMLKTGNLKEAGLNAWAAVKLLRINEHSAQLANVLCLYGRVLAHEGRTSEAKTIFVEAASVAVFIQNSELLAECRLFALRELFSFYNSGERAKIFSDVFQILRNSQEKEITDILEEIAEKIEDVELTSETVTGAQKVVPLSSKAENETIHLDKRLKEIELSYIEDALLRSGGNQSKAAQILGLKRQTLIARIKKDFPELEGKLQHRKPKNFNIFPSHLICLPARYRDEKIAVSILESDFKTYRTGDALLIKCGKWDIDKIVVLQSFNSQAIKLGIMRRDKSGLALESANGRLFYFNETGLKQIIGEVIGYCPALNYQKYLQQRGGGIQCELPFIQI